MLTGIPKQSYMIYFGMLLGKTPECVVICNCHLDTPMYTNDRHLSSVLPNMNRAYMLYKKKFTKLQL